MLNPSLEEAADGGFFVSIYRAFYLGISFGGGDIMITTHTADIPQELFVDFLHLCIYLLIFLSLPASPSGWAHFP